jgi:hypothetical protein
MKSEEWTWNEFFLSHLSLEHLSAQRRLTAGGNQE